MQRLVEIILVCAAIYVVYALTVKNWSYASEAVRKEQRARFKELGMSNVYYFTAEKKLFVLNILSGGIFVFYWLYKQWQAVMEGFQCLSRQPLKYGVITRTVFFFVSIYQLGSIINRTCVYLRKTPNQPAWFMGTVWLLSLLGVFVIPSWWAKTICYAAFCGVPALIQRRLNALPNVELPNKPKPFEVLFTSISLMAILAMAAALRVWLK